MFLLYCQVEKVEGDVQRLSEELEQLTRGLIEEHVSSNQTKEEALLSFLDTLKVRVSTTAEALMNLMPEISMGTSVLPPFAVAIN